MGCETRGGRVSAIGGVIFQSLPGSPTIAVFLGEKSEYLFEEENIFFGRGVENRREKIFWQIRIPLKIPSP